MIGVHLSTPFTILFIPDTGCNLHQFPQTLEREDGSGKLAWIVWAGICLISPFSGNGKCSAMGSLKDQGILPCDFPCFENPETLFS